MMYIEMEGLHEIEAALGMLRDKSKLVLRAAINDTAKTVNKTMIDKAHKKYIYKRTKSDIAKANKVKKAKTGVLEAKISAVGPQNELLDFRVSPSTYFPGGKGAPKWVKARAKRNEKFQRIALRMNATGDKYKGFVVRYKSGHFALAQRVPGKRMKSNPKKEALKSLLSLSHPKMEAMAYDETLAGGVVEDMLAENVRREIERFLGRKKK